MSYSGSTQLISVTRSEKDTDCGFKNRFNSALRTFVKGDVEWYLVNSRNVIL